MKKNEKMEKILIYSLVSLGDVIMATSVVPIIKAKYPQAKITMLAKDINAAVIVNNPNLDDYILYKYKSGSLGLKTLYNLIKEINKRNFDISFSLDRHKRGALINFLTNTKLRVGPKFIFDNSLSWSPKFYNKKINPNFKVMEDSRILIIQDIVNQYFKTNVLGRPSFGKITAKSVESAKNLIKTMPPKKHILGMCLQGNLPIRSWLPNKVVEFINYMQENEETNIFIIGTEEQREYAQNIINKGRSKAFNFCGQTPSLNELAALMLQADAFLGLDTGSSHMAAALGLPLLLLMGSSTPRRFKPLSCQAEAEQWNLELWSGRKCSPCQYWNQPECPLNMACMEDLTVGIVSEKIKHLFTLKEKHKKWLEKNHSNIFM